MSDNSKIEWTDATWNPIVGCSVVSPGCTNCYAMIMAARIEAMHGAAGTKTHYRGTTMKSKRQGVWTGKVALAPEKTMTAPLRWRDPRRIFVNSMGDLFHESIPDEWIDRVFAVMALCPQHTFQVLTKRAERMRDYLQSFLTATDHRPAFWKAWAEFGGTFDKIPNAPLPNVWLGVSAERQEEADERIPLLLQTPAAVRFVSCEPLLGPIDLWSDNIAFRSRGAERQWPGWIIAGGESGPRARVMHPDWARSLRDQCVAAGVPFFFKQWGEWRPAELDDLASEQLEDLELRNRLTLIGQREQCGYYCSEDVGHVDHGGQWMVRLGKRVAGRLLDGREHSEFPSLSGQRRDAA